MIPRQRPSPNHNPRPAPGRVDMLVLHYTGMKTAAEAIDRLCDPAAKVSSHYVVEEDGTVWQLVEESERAWHAGESFWQGTRDVNGVSVGIEIVNPGHDWGYRSFPEAQMVAVEELARGILARHPIPAHRVVGHSDVAPRRKQDPGELFDWRRLAKAGIGFWPEAMVPAAPVTIAEAQRLLREVGYDAPDSNSDDDGTRLVLTAFQRRFRPSRCDGVLDDETAARLSAAARAVAALRASG
jgi:N-acetylmuramoyl-L-alanine amidase